MSEAAVGKGIDDGASQKVRQPVVDHGSDERPERTAQDDHRHGHLARLSRHVGCRYHHHLARERDERTFDGHEQDNPSIVQVVQRTL